MHLHQKIHEEVLTSFLRVKEIRLNGEFISDCAILISLESTVLTLNMYTQSYAFFLNYIRYKLTEIS